MNIIGFNALVTNFKDNLAFNITNNKQAATKA